MIDPDRWDTLRELFHQARDLDPAERVAFVREHCADDATLRSELLALLDARNPIPFAPGVPAIHSGGGRWRAAAIHGGRALARRGATAGWPRA